MTQSLPSTGALVIGLLLGFMDSAHAHDPGLSTAELTIGGDVTAHVIFARRELETLTIIDQNLDGSVSPAEFAAAAPVLERLAMGILEIRVDGHRVAARRATVELGASDTLHFAIQFEERSGSRVELKSTLLAKLARGHRQYVSHRDGRGRVVGRGMLDAAHPSLELRPSSAGSVGAAGAAGDVLPSFRQFLVLGVEHIVTGYDHLLFLFALLMVGGSFKNAVRIVSSFTVAHSLTLALATFDLVRLPPSVVEPLIALSILYVGLENLFRRDMNQRWLLTFGFGLVHGLGFASVLRNVGVGVGSGGNVVAPLLAFNIGVELGQVAIAALVLPLIWRSQKLPGFAPRFVTACSMVVVLAGVYWLLERTVFS